MLNLFKLEIGVQVACCGWIHPQPPGNACGGHTALTFVFNLSGIS